MNQSIDIKLFHFKKPQNSVYPHSYFGFQEYW
jgi:hypothetical protein